MDGSTRANRIRRRNMTDGKKAIVGKRSSSCLEEKSGNFIGYIKGIKAGLQGVN